MSVNVRNVASAKGRSVSVGAAPQSTIDFKPGTPGSSSNSTGTYVKVDSSSEMKTRHKFRGEGGKFAKDPAKSTDQSDLTNMRDQAKRSSRPNSRASSVHSLSSIPESHAAERQAQHPDSFFIGSPNVVANDDASEIYSVNDGHMSFDHAAGLLQDLDDAFAEMNAGLSGNPQVSVDTVTVPTHTPGNESSHDVTTAKNVCMPNNDNVNQGQAPDFPH